MDVILIFLPLLIVAGVLVLIYRALRAHYPDDRAYKAAVILSLVATLLLFWINGAVGIIGDSSNKANLMFAGVVAVAVVGALLAKFRPIGMAIALAATAVAQTIVAGIVLAGELGSEGPIWPRDVLMVTAFFTGLWLLSAWLFQRSALRHARTTQEEGA